ncbi:MAG: hypothetical protein ACRD2E_14590 [Terriglobales bacterium]
MPTLPTDPPSAPPAPATRRLGGRGALILIGVFVLGVIAGGGGGLWLAPHVRRPMSRQDRYVRHMTRLLQLTPAQARQFRAIVVDMRQHWGQIHQQLQPQYQALFTQELLDFAPIRAQERARVRAMLDPRQQAKFNAWVTQWDRQHQGRVHPGADTAAGQPRARQP